MTAHPARGLPPSVWIWITRVWWRKLQASRYPSQVHPRGGPPPDEEGTLSSIDPRQAAFRATEEARRRAAERAREQAHARQLAERLSSALESRGAPAAEVARILRDAESLSPEGRVRFVEEAGPRGAGASGQRSLAEAADSLRARVAEAFPEASDRRRQLGESLASLRGEDPRRHPRESLESLVSETLSRLGATAAALRLADSVRGTTGDLLERAPDVSRFGGGFRPAGAVAREVEDGTGTDLREWHGETLGSAQVRPNVSVGGPGPLMTGDPSAEPTAPSPPRSTTAEVAPRRPAAATPQVSPEVTRTAPPMGHSAAGLPEQPVHAEAARARAAEVALDREDLAAALGQPHVKERPVSPITSTDAGQVSAAEALRTDAARPERAELAQEVKEGFFTRLRHALVLTPSVAEAVLSPALRSAGGSIESAARSLARAH
jgi:hypothetical protein